MLNCRSFQGLKYQFERCGYFSKEYGQFLQSEKCKVLYSNKIITDFMVDNQMDDEFDGKE